MAKDAVALILVLIFCPLLLLPWFIEGENCLHAFNTLWGHVHDSDNCVTQGHAGGCWFQEWWFRGKLFISIVMQETTVMDDLVGTSSLESCDLHVTVFSTLIEKVILGFQDFSMENSTKEEGRS